MIGRALEAARIDCVVLIRPRGGDFLYGEEGIRVMLEDVIAVREAGAFDMARNPHEALDTLIELGVDRVLTSGRERSVIDALDLVADLVSQSDGRIAVMPGGGVSEENILEVLERTGAREVHFTAFSRRESAMDYRNDGPMMGAASVPGEYERLVTDVERVRAFLRAVS